MKQNNNNSRYVYRTVFSNSQKLIGEDPSCNSLKIVIRRLPPDMDEEKFLEQVSPLPEHDYMYFVKADWQYGKFAFSRAYINFVDEKDLFLFKEKYDGYVFLSSKGGEYPAVVEYATSSKIPKIRFNKHDPHCNTIDATFNYNMFLNTLTIGKRMCLEKNVNFETKITKPDNENVNKKKTPLLKYVAKKQQERGKTIDDGWKNKNKNYRESGCVFVNSNMRNNKRLY